MLNLKYGCTTLRKWGESAGGHSRPRKADSIMWHSFVTSPRSVWELWQEAELDGGLIISAGWPYFGNVPVQVVNYIKQEGGHSH